MAHKLLFKQEIRPSVFMPEWNRKQVERYLSAVVQHSVDVVNLEVLGGNHRGKVVKGYGYGVPVKVDFRVGGECRSGVLHTMTPGPFGHEHMSDRARELLWESQAFNRLPRHVRAMDVCGLQPDGSMISMGKVEEFCLFTEYVEGRAYADDLARIRDSGKITDPDVARADALCDYLVEIHQHRGTEEGLYVRRIRELVGDGECIMGIIDSYPPHPVIPPSLLKRIEHLCVNWRWKLKDRTERLRQVHGDFHPWNILFRSGVDFSVLDRSRGEYGEAGDDVTSLTLNYLFFSLQHSGKLEGGLETLFRRFWRRYLDRTNDRELLKLAPPFLAFRGLVMASPVWYPSLSDEVRQRILNFIVAVLESDSFEPELTNAYCGIA